jgi:hypothetical protein
MANPSAEKPHWGEMGHYAADWPKRKEAGRGECSMIECSMFKEGSTQPPVLEH